MLTPIVSALTSTLPSPGTGVGTSTYSSAAGPPGRRSRIAFMPAAGAQLSATIATARQVSRPDALKLPRFMPRPSRTGWSAPTSVFDACGRGRPNRLTDPAQKDRQSAASHRIPFLTDLILHRQAAACRRTVYASSGNPALPVIGRHGIAIALVAALPSAQVFHYRSLVHVRSSRAAIYDRT